LATDLERDSLKPLVNTSSQRGNMNTMDNGLHNVYTVAYTLGNTKLLILGRVTCSFI